MFQINVLAIALIVAECALLSNSTDADAGLKVINGGQSLCRYGKMPTQVQLNDAHTQMKISIAGADVQSKYVLSNSGKDPETLQVGFVSGLADNFEHMKAMVDGKQVEISRLKDDDDDTQHWKLWMLTFRPKQEITVVVSYETKYRIGDGDIVQHWLSPAMHHALFLQQELIDHAKPTDRYDLSRKMRTMEYWYDMASASRWSGLVGKYSIEVELVGISTQNIPFNARGGRLAVSIDSVVTDRIVWTQSQFEPKQNFGFSLTPNITRNELDQLLDAHRKRYATDPTAVMMSVGHRYLSGAKPEEIQPLVAELLKVWQTRVSRSGPDASASSVIVSTITQGIGLTDVPGYPKLFDATALVPEITTTIERLEGQRNRDGASQSTDYDSILRWCRQQSRK